ncbi:MAG: sigma-70 family RNA polymerase sigma factor [Gemmatimonadetes bacterium]|nr:sigma-70 family RNA polymerase sigma factor [Gemmatimonadota bacterium]
MAEAVTSRELLAFRCGDEVYFRALIDAYSPRLLACARSFLPDLDEARDVVQDAWVRAYERRRSYSGSAGPCSRGSSPCAAMPVCPRFVPAPCGSGPRARSARYGRYAQRPRPIRRPMPSAPRSGSWSMGLSRISRSVSGPW